MLHNNSTALPGVLLQVAAAISQAANHVPVFMLLNYSISWCVVAGGGGHQPGS